MSETETEKTPSLSRLDRRIARMESTPSSKKRSTAPGRPPCIEHALTIRDLQDYFGFEAPQAIYKRQEGKTIPSVDNLIALSRLFDIPVALIVVVKAVAVEGRDLIFVFRGKVSWMICETEDYGAV